MNPMTQEIIQMITEFKMTPKEINNGYCDQFAEELLHRLRVKYHIEGEIWEANIDGPFPTHVWAKVHGVFYDAESPEGVPSWKALPIMMNAFKHDPSLRRKRTGVYNLGRLQRSPDYDAIWSRDRQE